MGKYERERGARYERHIAEVLRDHGYEAERGCTRKEGKWLKETVRQDDSDEMKIVGK